MNIHVRSEAHIVFVVLKWITNERLAVTLQLSFVQMEEVWMKGGFKVPIGSAQSSNMLNGICKA